MQKSTIKASLVLVVIFFLSSCQKDDDFKFERTSAYSSDIVLSWIDLTLKLTKETPGFTPPVAARVYGYSGLGLYESVRFGMPGYKSMGGQITLFQEGIIPAVDEEEEYHWGAVASSTLSGILKGCFETASPAHKALMQDLEQQSIAQFRTEASDETIDRSIAHGESVAFQILFFANSDGQERCYQNNFPASYQTPVGEGLWEPTDPGTSIPLQPYWGSVRPFMKENIRALLPIAPPAYSTDPTSPFYLEAMEVYEAVNNITPEQKVIAEFWSDDPVASATPPGHSYSIMSQILTDEQADLAKAAEVYAKLGMGLHDAFISCWNTKYHYNLIRPITYVHRFIDDTWTIPLPTPPFPEYTSGHSVQSGASAQILTDIFGDNYAFIDKTHVDRSDIDGTARAFTSFFHFADEAAISRLYGGIHFRAAIDLGVEQGIEIGKNIDKLAFR